MIVGIDTMNYTTRSVYRNLDVMEPQTGSTGILFLIF